MKKIKFRIEALSNLLFQQFRPRSTSIELRSFKAFVAFVFNVGYVTILISLLTKLITANSIFLNKLKEELGYGASIAGNIFYPEKLGGLYTGSIADFENFHTWILAPMWEEFIFRWAPFYFFLRFMTEERLKRFLLPAVIFFSIIFGLAHGGPINILIQGVGGFLLWYIFLQSGRYRYVWSVAAHALWNFSISMGLFVIK